MLNDKEPNKIDMSKYIQSEKANEFDKPRDLLIYDSLLFHKDEESHLLNLVRQVLDKRGMSRGGSVVPKSFEDILPSTFAQIQEIDKKYQKGLISHDVAIELIADLIESDGIGQRFQEYANDLFIQRLRKLYKELKIAYEDLLDALNAGIITREEFEEKLSELRSLKVNSMREILETNEILSGRSR